MSRHEVRHVGAGLVLALIVGCRTPPCVDAEAASQRPPRPGPTRLGGGGVDFSQGAVPTDKYGLLALGAVIAVIPLVWAAMAAIDAIRAANPDALDCDGVCCLEEHRTGKLGRCHCSWRCPCRYEGATPPPLPR